jgi:hypothetical protein
MVAFKKVITDMADLVAPHGVAWLTNQPRHGPTHRFPTGSSSYRLVIFPSSFKLANKLLNLWNSRCTIYRLYTFHFDYLHSKPGSIQWEIYFWNRLSVIGRTYQICCPKNELTIQIWTYFLINFTLRPWIFLDYKRILTFTKYFG